jgi:hypothetical protein
MNDPIQQMQTSYVLADSAGRITQVGQMPRFMIDKQVPPAGGSLVIGKGHWDTDYVSGGVIVPRPANPGALDGMTLKNLPAPCTITLEGVDYACTDDTCELSFSHAGTFSIKVTPAWPMLDATFEVTQA